MPSIEYDAYERWMMLFTFRRSDKRPGSCNSLHSGRIARMLTQGDSPDAVVFSGQCVSQLVDRVSQSCSQSMAVCCAYCHVEDRPSFTLLFHTNVKAE